MGEKVTDISFPRERSSHKECFPSPRDGELLFETPPTFIWNKVPSAQEYKITVFNSNGEKIISEETRELFFTPSEPLPSGKYAWDVECESVRRGVQSFEISEDALFFNRPSAEELWSSIPVSRPRHLFFESDIDALCAEHPAALRTLENNVNAAYAHGFPEPPEFHKDENAVPYRKYFGELRDFCDRDLIATALKYALTKDERAGEHARRLLLVLCKNMLEDERYLTAGSLDAKTGDEVGLSMARCLPSAFDLLYPLLSKEERAQVAKTVYIYGDACKKRLREVDYINNPASSHAGRLPAYLGEAAAALKGEGVAPDSELTEWLSDALDIYCGIFPYYGGTDGSWAEGAFYASSYTKWYLPFFSLVERYTGKSLFERPFYHRLTNFLIHFVNPRYEIHPFGDGYWCSPSSPEWPGFFAQNPFNVYAERFGPSYARSLSSSLENQELFSLHLLDLFLPKSKRPVRSLAHEPRDCEIFEDGGFAALHSNLFDEDGVTLLARASRFGSDSHRHADQGSFALFSGGTVLISPSGYFGFKFGTAHHTEWTNSTKAHNTLLINGEGQPKNSMLSRGRIAEFSESEKRVLLDISDAYSGAYSVTREMMLTEYGARITDTVITDEESVITYPLHTLSRPEINERGNVCVRRGGALLEIVTDSLELDCISDEYDTPLNEGVREDCQVSMPEQFHIYYKSKASCSHKITVDYKIRS